jgi:hypothetical protein
VKRISKKVREEAALFCALLASFVAVPNDGSGPFFVVRDYVTASSVTDETTRLVDAAFNHVKGSLPLAFPDYGRAFTVGGCASCGSPDRDGGSLYYAEAEALLRTGWCPP